MNRAGKATATISSRANLFQLRACSFHGTPLLERRRRTHWDSESSFRSSPRKFNQYSKRLRRQSLLRNVSEFAEHLFQSWQSERNGHDGHAWFRPDFEDDGFKTGKSRNRRSQTWRRDFDFCNGDEDDVEFETIFRKAFGGNRNFYWSFTIDDEPRYWSSSRNSRSRSSSSGWRYHYEEEEDYDSSSEYEKPGADMSSDRIALGLSVSGPLNLEDVKTAYRECALKWHPDRHQGSSKVVAEEKFKACSAAYQSLCNKLTLN